MTDTRRQAAEEWMRSMGYRALTEPAPPEIEDAHLAGQLLGEQREREAVVKWIAKRANGWTSVSIALAIERGEHREEGK